MSWRRQMARRICSSYPFRIRKSTLFTSKTASPGPCEKSQANSFRFLIILSCRVILLSCSRVTQLPLQLRDKILRSQRYLRRLKMLSAQLFSHSQRQLMTKNSKCSLFAKKRWKLRTMRTLLRRYSIEVILFRRSQVKTRS